MIETFEKTGERFIPTDTNPTEVQVNLERYMFALQFCKDKVVLDAGIGSGLGTYLYSLVAKRVIAMDYNDDAFRYAKLFPYDPRKVQFIKADFEKDVLPDHEVCVALEVIEHLANPDFFLSQLKGKELLFSVPFPSLSISKWHKYEFSSVGDVKELLERYYKVPHFYTQHGRWAYGKAEKL